MPSDRIACLYARRRYACRAAGYGFRVFQRSWIRGFQETKKPGTQDYKDVIDTDDVSNDERVLLWACRGRSRRGRRVGGDYYTPAYIGLTRHFWLRNESDRAIRDYFLRGPLAPQEGLVRISEADKKTIVDALIGHRTAKDEDNCEGRELLSLIGINDRQDPDSKQILRKLEEVWNEGPASAPLRSREDPLAEIIAQDFVEICRVEKFLPRREWLFLLLAFIRIATSMWLLAHLRITVLVRDWVLKACSKKNWPRIPDMSRALSSRYEGLLHPTSSPTREVFEILDDYMRARIELRVLVGQIDKERPGNLEGRRLTLDSEGANQLTLDDLLICARNINWDTVTGGATVRRWLTRECESWAAWRSPRNRGQGKNLREFIRVLYHFPDDDSGSSLLQRSRNPHTAKIVPGHRLLQLFAFLAERCKTRDRSKAGQGKLVLWDIEEHMYRYGIDFRSGSCGRPLLVETLTEAGILVGSPDAGESAEVLNVIRTRGA